MPPFGVTFFRRQEMPSFRLVHEVYRALMAVVKNRILAT